jgi:hypothetical protein
MAFVEFQITSAEDRSHIRIDVLVDGASTVWTEMEAPELDAFLHLLISARIHLLPEVTREPDPGWRVPGIEDPIWHACSIPTENKVALALRHPGAGWTGWKLSPDRARIIAAALDHAADH